MELFTKLGAEVEILWRDKNYDEEVFPEIAANALKAANLPAKISAWEVIEWTMGETNLPTQQDLSGKFGDPPITIYNGPRFHIDVYFWLEGTTAIHQHSFCGAFQVLHGSSIHSWYDFERSIGSFALYLRVYRRHCLFSKKEQRGSSHPLSQALSNYSPRDERQPMKACRV